MSLNIEGVNNKVVSLETYRDSRNKRVQPDESSYHTVDRSTLLQEIQPRSLFAMSVWNDLIAGSEKPNFERMSRDWSTAPGPYDLDMPRYGQARARFLEDHNEFLRWKERVSKLFLMHCAHRCGEPIAVDDLDAVYRAYVRGELRPSEFNFDTNIKTSPYETLLIGSFHTLQGGLTSTNSDIARDSIELSSDILQALSGAEGVDVLEEAEVIRDAAICFLHRSEVPEDSARISYSLNQLSLNFPGIRNGVVNMLIQSAPLMIPSR